MKQTKSLMMLAGAALGLSSVALAQQSDDLRAKERELQSDASLRSSFAADESKPTLDLTGYTQFRYDLNWRDDGGNNTGITNGNTLTNGFSFAKTKLQAAGNITDEWSYKFQGAFATSGGGFALDDMYGQYTMDNGWNFQAGQKKLPFLHEELVKDTGQQAAERSNNNDTYSLGRAQGIFVNYTTDAWRFMGAFSDGSRTQNTDYDSGVASGTTPGPANGEADWAFTGRGEWKWAGEWSRFDQYSSWNGSENAGMVGFAAHYQDGGSTIATNVPANNETLDSSLFEATIDVSIQGSGWNVGAAGIYSLASPDVGDDITDVGLQLQGGFFVTDDWELFGRGSWIIPDDNDVNAGVGGVQERDDFWTLTLGANYFFTPQSQNVRFTIEVIYVPDEQQSLNNGGLANNAAPSTQSGILPDAEGGQWDLRGQLQLIF